MFAFLLLSQCLLPLSEPSHWITPSFENHKNNTFSNEKEGLQIQVNESSSPLFIKLSKPMEIHSLSVEGSLSGLPNLAGYSEGIEKGDDFALRVGLVSPGERPGWLKRLLLPKWIKALLDVNPTEGFSEVHFYKISQTLPVGQTREHPQLKNVFEEVALQMKNAGPFRFEKNLSVPIPTFALWIQSDGDDTYSTFSVTIKELILCNPPSATK